jgi:hypothetical protein
VHRHALDLHPAQHHLHGHIGQGLFVRLTGEDELPFLGLAEFL